MKTRFEFNLSLKLHFGLVAYLVEGDGGWESAHLTRGFKTTFLNERERERGVYPDSKSLVPQIQQHSGLVYCSPRHCSASQGLSFSSSSHGTNMNERSIRKSRILKVMIIQEDHNHDRKDHQHNKCSPIILRIIRPMRSNLWCLGQRY